MRSRLSASSSAARTCHWVEDYPLAPEEETPELRDLANGLQLWLLRVVGHWNGNTHRTLTATIVRTVEWRACGLAINRANDNPLQ
jgi:hypothetical protein